MEQNTVLFRNKGMYQDPSVSKSSDEFAFKNVNIRITAVNDTTQFSVTSEKLPSDVSFYDSDEEAAGSILGSYFGKCIIGDYLVLFTHENTTDRIYRCWLDGNNIAFKLLVEKDLGFVNPVETVGSYEREDIIKVYWVDGVNPNRLINIMAETQPDSFDFLPTLDNSFPSGDISKSYGGSGKFPSGVIQYFASYYNNLGQETKIIWASDLQYITFESRGGKQDETVNCTFTIKLSYVDQSFDYIRIYSAKRTSLDSPIEAAIVGDYKITSDYMEIEDNNTNIESIDASLLYYIGGDSFTATTIEDKDNVLFFGDIETSGNIVISDSEASTISNAFKNYISFEYKTTDYSVDNVKYSYEFQLSNSQRRVATFKFGETYRVGVQLQTNTGEWTQPIYVKDMVCDKAPIYKTDSGNRVVSIAGLSCIYPFQQIGDYENYRLVIAKTSQSTRNILAQGILNPTVFNLKERCDHSPDAVCSWITRTLGYDGTRWEHMDALTEDADADTKYRAEIQCTPMHEQPTYSGQDHSSHISTYASWFYIDSSVLTLNSPDITYDNVNVHGLSLNIVGAADVYSHYSDFDLSVINKQFPQSNVVPRTNEEALVSDFLYDFKIDFKNDDYDLDFRAKFKTYLWHKFAPSFGIPNPDNTDEIENKLFANYTYCGHTRYLVNQYAYNNVDMETVDSDSSSIVKCGNLYYTPNYDKVVPANNDGYPIKILQNGTVKDVKENYNPLTGDWTGDTVMCHDPLRIRFNSTKHAVIAARKINSQIEILPRINTTVWSLQRIYGNNVPTSYDFDTDLTYIQNSIYSNSSTYDTETTTESYDYDSHVFIAEVRRNLTANQLYGTDPKKNSWIPASETVQTASSILPQFTFGDTYFQRWECLRTYPSSDSNMENSIVDIVSFMVESHINLDGRSDVNRGYQNQKRARPYNYGLMNKVYSQTNNIFSYNIFDDRFDQTKFPTQFAWSLNKSAASKTDSWANTSLSNIANVDGKYGKINAIEKLNDTLVCFQDKAICVINFNNRTQISTEQGLPIELANSGKVNGVTYLTTNYGCKNKYSIVNAKTGLYFIDDENRALIRIGKDGIADISTSCGMSVWFKKFGAYGRLFDGSSQDWDSFICDYDSNRGDIYIMLNTFYHTENNGACLVYNEITGTFTSFFNNSIGHYYKAMWNEDGETFGIDNGISGISAKKLFGNTQYSKNYSIEYRINPEPLVDKTFTNIEYIADMLNSYSPRLNNILPFETLEAWDEYQQGQPVNLTVNNYGTTDNKTKFRIRRANIPRPTTNYGLDRMRNPWIHLKLSSSRSAGSEMMEFHSLAVKYFKQ